LNRLNELSFNSSLMREMRAVAFVTRLIEDGKMTDGEMTKLFMHSIEDEAYMSSLGSASKLDPDWRFLCDLRDHGRHIAEDWLNRNFDHIGVKSTVDIRAKYL